MTFQQYLSTPERILSEGFGKWGYFVARNAWRFILTTGCFGIFSSIGLFWLSTEKDINVFDIYFPRNGRVTKSLKEMKDVFPDTSDTNYFPWQDNGEYVTLSIIFWDAQGDKKDVVANEGVRNDVEKICNFVTKFEVRVEEFNKTLTYKDVCAVDGMAAMGIYGKKNECLLPELCRTVGKQTKGVNKWKIPDGITYQDESILQMFSEPVWKQQGIKVTVLKGGKSGRIIFFLRKASPDQLKDSYSWVRPCFEELHVMVKNLKSAKFALYSLRIQLDEWGSVFGKDAKLFALAIIFLVGFSVVASSSLDCLTSRSLLALAGILSTILAIVSGISILSLLGIPLIQVAFITPFIILGVGIDGAFVMMFTWAKTEKLGLNVEERVGATLNHCFASIFMSNLTSLLAFTIGSFTPYMAVNISCYFLAAMIIALTFFELTFFTACLSIHTKRVQCTSRPADKNHHQFSLTSDEFQTVQNLSHIVSKKRLRSGEEGKDPTSRKKLSDTSYHSMGYADDKEESWALNFAEKYLIKYMPKVILHDLSRVTVLLIVGVLLAVATRSTIKMPEYINEVEYQPDDSKVTEYYHTEESLFRKPTVVSFIIDEKLNYTEPKTKELLEKLVSDLIQTGFFLNVTKLSWLNYPNLDIDSLVLARQGKEISQPVFKDFATFAKFQENQLLQVMFKNDIIVNDDGEILKSRFVLLTINITQYDADTIRNFFTSMYRTLDRFPYRVVPTSIHLSRWERNITMKHSIWISIGIGLVCCFFVMAALLGDVRVILLSVVVTACSMISVLGFMGVWGITYNMSTYIEVLLLIGLCVDYVSHSGHSYKRSLGVDSRQRAHTALEAMGVPLVNAAVSSLLGIVMLAFSSSYGMRTLFITALFLFTFSFFYGVFVLPVLLSFFGPASTSSNGHYVTDFAKPWGFLKQRRKSSSVERENSDKIFAESQLGSAAILLNEQNRLSPSANDNGIEAITASAVQAITRDQPLSSII